MVAEWWQFLKTSKPDKPLLYSVIGYSPLANYAKLKKKGPSNFFESPVFIGRDGEI